MPLTSRSGLSPAVSSNVEATSGPTPLRLVSVGAICSVGQLRLRRASLVLIGPCDPATPQVNSRTKSTTASSARCPTGLQTFGQDRCVSAHLYPRLADGMGRELAERTRQITTVTTVELPAGCGR